MLNTKRWIFLALCLGAAALCYVSGLLSGALGFIIAGAVFETLFWFRLLDKKTPK